MSAFQAGFGRADITPKLGCKLVGYGGREEGATAVHDPAGASVGDRAGGKLLGADLG
ncbi:MAG: hypothetical protein R3E79_40760 [Caldilineaceae bacterium]